MTEATHRPLTHGTTADADALGGLSLPSLAPETRELLVALSLEERKSRGTEVSPEEHARRLLARLGDGSGWESSRVRAARLAIEQYLEEQGGAPVRRERPSRDRRPALVTEAESGRARLAFSFGGQGAPYLDELRALYARSHRTRRLLDAVADRLIALVDDLPAAEAALFSQGIDFRPWLADPAARPEERYLSSSAVCSPLLFATQMALAEDLLAAGFDGLDAGSVVAVLGHSQGAMAAACFSELFGERDVDVRAQRAVEYAAYYLFQGIRMQQGLVAAPSPEVVRRALEAGASVPTPMASVRGLLSEELEAELRASGLPVVLSLDNAPFYKVVSGRPEHLEVLRARLSDRTEALKKAKTKGRAAGRAPEVRWEYLPVSGPFHSPLFEDKAERLLDDVRALGFTVPEGALKLPVTDPSSGRPLPNDGTLVETLVRRILVDPVSWRRALAEVRALEVTHLVDLGPSDAVAGLSHSTLRGSGVAVVAAATAEGRERLLDTERAPAPSERAFASYRPRLVELPSGELRIDNRFTRVTGRPPVLLPGMTPTTVEAPIVVAAANAGFVAELAGGGQVTERILRTRLDEIRETLEPGQGIVFNALYLDPYLWGLHFAKERLVFKLKDEGYPIVGVTVSAGIPPKDEAVRLLRDLWAHGITWNALKPGNDSQLKEVMAIAEAVPELPLLVHLEGGKAGGHHSWEDLDDLLLRHYAALRRHDNLVLAVGGGIGREEQSTAYLTGAWSERYGLVAMPVDAVFLGTRLMATREARTSAAVKERLVRAPGSEQWPLDGTVAGEVTSGRSQLDASIYYLDNAAARAGRLLDEVAGDAEKVAARRDGIIEALAKTAKPWFGDVERMTYFALLHRLAELTAFGRGSTYEDGPWPDVSYRQRFEAMFQRAEARLSPDARRSLVDEAPGLDAPFALIERLREELPAADRALVHPEDARFFLEVCRRPGKPVCFVPVIDADVRRWYKADSLWQAHDPRYAADQVLALPGPSAVAGIARPDEPVAEVLGSFCRHAVDALVAKGAEPMPLSSTADVRATAGAAGPSLGVVSPEDADLEAPERWYARLATLGGGPLAGALLEANAVISAGGAARLGPSPLRALLAPQRGTSVAWRTSDSGELSEVTVHDEKDRLIARAALGPKAGDDVRVLAELVARARRTAGAQEEPVTLDLALAWRGAPPSGHLVWDRDRYLAAQQTFFGTLLFGEPLDVPAPFADATDEVALSRGAIEAFVAATADDSRGLLEPAALATAPLSMAFPLAWKAIFRALAAARPDVLHLVHEGNEVEAREAWPLVEGDRALVRARVIAVEEVPGGRRVVTRADIAPGRDEALAAVVTSRFFIRQNIDVTPGRAERREALRARLQLDSEADVAFLAEQPWLSLEDELVTGAEFHLMCDLTVEVRDGASRFAATGRLLQDGVVVGDVRLSADDVPEGTERHPVLEVCRLLSAPEGEVSLKAPRPLGEKRLRAPSSMLAYARASGDLNPLHLDDVVARFAGFAAPIVHGMWTASVAQHRVARLAAEGEADKVRRFEARFLAPVDRGEPLSVAVRQRAVRAGVRLLDVEVAAQRGADEVPVLSGTAEVAAPRTAYVFPGQGIQATSMGMDGYARSPAARAVWDEADAVCRERFGFSLLDVVRKNPRELYVRGRRLTHPSGVLFLTQFTQVAMAVMAVAQTRELEEQGLLVDEALYAGHSLGEYSALAALSGVMPLAGVVEVVYHRGLTMDRLVERDEAGRSPYAMGVVRPHYAGLDEPSTLALVELVARETGGFLEVVNYNVRGRQYSVTGERRALARLEERLQELADERPRENQKPAYLEVPGIDVPFHSTLLRSGVPAFRETLDKVLSERVSARALEGRYLPNLTGTVFRLERAFLEEMLAACGSPRVRALLDAWPLAKADPDQLARDLLIEALAYQFASPVRWIQILDVMFDSTATVEVMVEVGAAHQPTLANLARQTLAGRDGARAPRVLHSELDRERLYGPDADLEVDPRPAAATPAAEAAPTTSAATEKAAEPEKAAPQATAATRPASSAGALPDEAPSAAEGLFSLLALHAKRRRDQIDAGQSLDALLGGNSARRNQVLADVAAEFGARALDGAHEMPLHALAGALAEQAKGYTGSGAYLGAAQDQALQRVLGPAGVDRREVERYLEETWRLSGGARVAVLNRLVLAARDGDSAAGGPLSMHAPGRLSDRAAAHAWLDALVAAYGEERGVRLEKPAAEVASVAVDGAALSELEDRILGERGVLARANRFLAKELGIDTGAGREVLPEAEHEAERRLSLYEDEHGEGYLDAIAPRFDAKKHVAFTSAWAWARRDVVGLFHRLRAGEPVDAGQERRLSARMGDDARRLAAVLATRALDAGDENTAAVMRRLAAAPSEARYLPDFAPARPRAMLDERGQVLVEELPRDGEPTPSALTEALLKAKHVSLSGHESRATLDLYSDLLAQVTNAGLDLRGRTALVTGAGPGSIALDVVKALLEGGARVVVTTSRYSAERMLELKRLYQRHAALGAELHVVPANQGAFADIDALTEWLVTPLKERVGSSERVVKEPLLPDLVLPFGAIAETADLTGMGGRSLAVLRVLLLGVERLVARLAAAHRDHGDPARKLHVVLPLSPNHGAFGGDGAYGESKAALEALLSKWRSEQAAWARHVTLVGARIGWVRGTGLMHANDAVSAHLEDGGLRTFSTEEMALLLTTLFADEVRERAAAEPLLADLTGGLGAVSGLGDRLRDARLGLERESRRLRRLFELRTALREALGLRDEAKAPLSPLARPTLQVPRPERGDLDELPPLDHLDPEQVIVIAGYGEVGPWGSARTRWAIEQGGALSLEAAAELAWMMGLIVPDEKGAGFVDAESKEREDDLAILERYQARVLEHAGVRVIEPEVVGFDPRALPRLVEVHLDRDFSFPAPSREVAEAIRAEDPEHTEVHDDAGALVVTRKRGAVVRVPAALKIDRHVAGQIPTGWDATRYGIPKEMVEQIDPVTLYCLVSTAEAFLAAGLEPEEVYQYLHPSRVGITIGTGIGGMTKLKRLHRDFYNGAERQNDTLQETLINVIGGYVVQSYLGSYGPMSFPVGACATGGLSIGDGIEKILTGSADLVVAGGADDLSEAGLIGFADMGATAVTDELAARGVEPRHMSRPNDRRRRGFVESQGAGVVVLCRASVALKMGLPVYGIVAYAGSSGDGLQRSVPAPGQGALVCATEVPSTGPRGKACDFAERRARIKDLLARRGELAAMFGADEADRLIAAARKELAHDFFRGKAEVAPLRGALAVFGLEADDVGVVSKHDSSTQANDWNESRLHTELMRALGRTEGLPLAVISQKALTGHPKGAAAAWQVNGLLQAMAEGVLPGNPSLDDVDPEMREFKDLVFTDAEYRVGWQQLRAGLVTTLGFGHVSALLCLVHPYYFWRMLSGEEREEYRAKLEQRVQAADARLQGVLSGRRPLLKVRTERPFAGKPGEPEHLADETRALTDGRARLTAGGERYLVGGDA